MIFKKYAIKKIIAREVLDSRGNPTVEADVITKAGLSRAIVPSGASTGTHEALELRDKGKRYHGKGVLKAVNNVNKKIAPRLIGLDCVKQKTIDHAMISLDGTKNKTNLGANATLAVSMAVCKAAAHYLQVPLYEYIGSLSNRHAHLMPIPQLNVINGGRHAGIDNDVQEHMIMPVGAKNFHEAIRMSIETYHELKKLLKKKYGAHGTLLGDEGGFVPKLPTVAARLDMISKAIKNARYSTNKIKFALDAASSEFFYKNHYKIGKKKYSSGDMVDFYADLVKKYPIISIEDGMAEDDWDGWAELTKKLGKKIQIVGDDNLVTNPVRIKKAIFSHSCNSLLLKVNQIGTVTEAIRATKLANKHRWSVVVSHRSGETEDHFISDLVVGLAAGQSKFGGPARSERNAKYNQLLRIEEKLKTRARYFNWKR